MKKCSERRKRCVLAVVGRAIFFSAADPFPGMQDGQNLISWRWSLPLPTNQVWWGSMHTISSYHGNRPTHPQTHTQPQTDRQDQLQYTALQQAHSVIKMNVVHSICQMSVNFNFKQ